MIKYKKPDILAILRLFGHADDNTGGRQIDQVKTHDVDDQNTLLSFRYSKHLYFLLTDHRAHDEQDYIIDILSPFLSDEGGVLLVNPTMPESFAMPYKGKEVYLYEQAPEKTRLDKELVKRYPDISRSTLQKYIKEGYVTVNGDPIAIPRTEISSQDALALTIPTPADYTDQSFPILYIDDDMIAIEKPVGTLTHSKGALDDEFTVADFFARYTTFASDTNRPGIIHRLDRDTSGVIIGARTEEAAEHLKKQFSNRSAKKTYYAVVEGVPKNLQAIIDIPIGRSPSQPSTFQADAKGKPAITEYEVVKTDGKRSLIKLSPRTGRTHQLRVHMKFIGTPIVGDRVYGKSADRLYLHAAELQVTLPSTGKMLTISSTVPVEFNQLVAS